MNWRRWPRRAAMGLIRAYQMTLSHLVFTQCRFTPSCSQYTLEAPWNDASSWPSC